MDQFAKGGLIQRTILLKEALLWDLYRDPLRSLTLLSLNVLHQAKNRKIPFSSFKEPSFLMRPNGLQISTLVTFEIFGSPRNHGKKFQKLSQTSFSGIVHYGNLLP